MSMGKQSCMWTCAVLGEGAYTQRILWYNLVLDTATFAGSLAMQSPPTCDPITAARAC
jgi:hypothetical protein